MQGFELKAMEYLWRRGFTKRKYFYLQEIKSKNSAHPLLNSPIIGNCPLYKGQRQTPTLNSEPCKPIQSCTT